MVAPAAPTLLTPVSGAVVSLAILTQRVSWQHNPLDGSTQAAAQLQLSANGGSSWTTIQITGSAQYYDHPVNWAVNGTITWRVRTKGAHADYGPYASNRTFAVYQVPTVDITSPVNDHDDIADMPLVISYTYSDPSGSFSLAFLELKDANGVTVYQETSTTAGSFTVSTEEFLPTNLSTYTIIITTVSTSTLSSSTSRIIDIDYVEPDIPSAEIAVDMTDASASIMVDKGASADLPATASLGVFRQMPDGALISIAQGLQPFAVVRDDYPPLDVEFAYVVVAYTATGLSSRALYPQMFDSQGALYVSFGADMRQCCRIVYNRDSGASLVADRLYYPVAGMPRPLVFFGSAEDSKGTVSGVVWRVVPNDLPISAHTTLDDLRALAAWHGSAVIRAKEIGTKVAALECSWAKGAAGSFDASLAWVEVENFGLVI
jgi:hypothetical protein